MTNQIVSFQVAVEGIVDEAALKSILRHLGLRSSGVFGKNGKNDLLKNLSGYNRAAEFFPWVVVVDLDSDAQCAPEFVAGWLPFPSRFMCFRIAVREIEAWLIADRDRISEFLSIPKARVPLSPDELEDPKNCMVNLARASRRKEIRDDMVPRPGSRRAVGPSYSARLIEFVNHVDKCWRPDVAAENSDSLARCMRAIKRMADAFGGCRY